jgi:hypothetical protein
MSDTKAAARQHALVGGGEWRCVPTTQLARPSTKYPSPASRWCLGVKSTRMASALLEPACLDLPPTARNGQFSSGMKIRPMA